ncbi:MAG: cytochrome c peroxidase [Bythopirellula sp.]|nr:cytochrome c peroxidase [Bythopirellula sp.]
MPEFLARTAFVCCSALALLASSVSWAAPGVPVLPVSPADYVGYAVTNIPNYWKSGAIAQANNTPANNQITNAGATLGRVLFYDERLSHDNGTSCASCHKQENDFSDPNQFSEGFDGQQTARHSMGLSNNAYYRRGKYFWDERAATLEAQVLQPIESSVEMGSTLSQVRSELATTSFYPQLFQQAFGTPDITDDRIAKALSQFVRSMVSYNSKFDQAVAAGTPTAPNYAAVYNSQEQLGATIFHVNNQCSQCHTTNVQVAANTHNIGLDANSAATDGAGNGRFKAPSLRNVEVRDGYMHDGRFDSLEEVVQFYSSGIQNNPFLDNALNPSQGNLFTPNERAALVAFLKTFTDNTFLTSSFFSDPFVSLPGDFDGNGVVNSADLPFWQASFGLDSGGDADEDGDSDGRDYLVWQRNIGMTWDDLMPLSAFQAVPEPSTALLGGALLVAAFWRRRLRACGN